MNQHPRSVPPVRSSVDEFPETPSADAGLPPPLDEIAARPRSGSAIDDRARRKRRSSGSQSPKTPKRAKPRGSQSRQAAIAPGEVVVGRFVGLSELGEPLVEHALSPDSEGYLLARSTVALEQGQIGREVVLAFERGDPRSPIILGILWQPDEGSPGTLRARPATDQTRLEAQRDGEPLVLVAEKEIVLRCGEASITLTRAGKILLRGTYLLSRSSGVNRIKGGSVQIN